MNSISNNNKNHRSVNLFKIFITQKRKLTIYKAIKC